MCFSFNQKRIQSLLALMIEDTPSFPSSDTCHHCIRVKLCPDEEKTSRFVSRAVTSVAVGSPKGSRPSRGIAVLRRSRFEVNPLNWQFPGGESLELGTEDRYGSVMISAYQCPKWY